MQEYLGSFGLYDWLWRDDKDHFYQARRKPFWCIYMCVCTCVRPIFDCECMCRICMCVCVLHSSVSVCVSAIRLLLSTP